MICIGHPERLTSISQPSCRITLAKATQAGKWSLRETHVGFGRAVLAAVVSSQSSDADQDRYA